MSIKHRFVPIACAAVAVATGGILFTPPPPAAADCIWHAPGQVELDQDDGWRITIPLAGPGATSWRRGGARYSNPNNPDWSYGDHSGTLDGNHVVIDVSWNNGSNGHYDGFIYQNGVATGQSTYFNEAGKQTFSSGWSSNKFICQKV